MNFEEPQTTMVRLHVDVGDHCSSYLLVFYLLILAGNSKKALNYVVESFVILASATAFIVRLNPTAEVILFFVPLWTACT